MGSGRDVWAVTACESGEQIPYVVAVPVEATDAQLLSFARDAQTRGEMLGSPKRKGPMRVLREKMPRKGVGSLTDGVDDLFIEEWTSEVYFLRESVYGLTTYHHVRDWILTPAYSARIRAVDPFEPQFELWKRGASVVSTWGPLGDGVAVFVK